MRRVERGAPPAFTKQAEFFHRRAEYELFRAEGGTRSRQTFVDIDEALGPYLQWISNYAFDAFRGKCAYLEVPLAEVRPVHLHRPAADAFDERRGPSAEHYWWMVFWFQNWYSASPQIESLKRNTFSVTGNRATVPRFGATDALARRGTQMADLPPAWHPLRLRRDSGLLLDPCADFPQLHLRFTPDGVAHAWSEARAPWLSRRQFNRGAATIQSLDLNSQELIEARRYYAAQLASQGFATPLLRDERLPHLGAVRQIAAAHELEETGPDSELLEELAAEVVPLLAHGPHTKQRRRLAQKMLRVLPPQHKSLRRVLSQAFSLSDGTRSPSPSGGIAAMTPIAQPIPQVSRNAVLSRVQIRNFQAIDFFDFAFPQSVERLGSADDSSDHEPGPPPGPSERPWWVLLGENGAGKSSVLKAIGLALAGPTLPRLIETSGLRWDDLIRRNAREGHVQLDFTDGSRVTLRFTSSGPEASSTQAELGGSVRGFGASQYRQGTGDEAADPRRLGNLFDPMSPVINPEQWLLSISDEDFNAVGVAIARLLDRADDVAERSAAIRPFLARSARGVTVADEPLRTLSDGYRAIIALACDLMAGAGAGLSDMRNASGIVLLDELGAHLHPRWKMKVTRALRDQFRSMQFIVTTHDPLCLRGLGEREVIGVRRTTTSEDQPWRAAFELVEQSPSRLRVDQLLTSDFFGLSTTIDPDVDAEFQRYYSLIRLENPSPEQRREREVLRGRLARYGVLGYTARDQMVYEAIDQFLAKQSVMDSEERQKQRAQVLRSVAQLWRGVASQYGGGTPS